MSGLTGRLCKSEVNTHDDSDYCKCKPFVMSLCRDFMSVAELCIAEVAWGVE